MTCAVGEPFGFDPSGEVVICAHQTDLEVFREMAQEGLYLFDRLPVYVVAAGALVGLVVLLLAALTVKALLS